MIITSLYTYLAILNRKKLPNIEWFFPAFLLGLILPDIDTLAIQFKILSFNSSNTFGHSIILALLIYLILLINYEVNKKNKYLNLSNGLMSGILLHIFLDSIISINPINIFWPLPFNSINLYDNILIHYYLKIYINIFLFLLFRYFFFFSIECNLNSKYKNGYLIKLLSFSMKIEYFIILLYIFTLLFGLKNISNIIFNAGYCFSILVVYIAIIKGWNTYNYFDNKTNIKKDLFSKEREMINLH